MIRIAHQAVAEVARRRTATGVSIVIEGAPGIGKTFLIREILAACVPARVRILPMTGDHRQRNEAFAGARQLLAAAVDGAVDSTHQGNDGGHPGDAAFDRVDELCADGPLVLVVDDAHRLDAASLTLLRRLIWASQSLPLVVLLAARPFPPREQLTRLVQQAQVRLTLPPMDKMMVERLVFDRTGRWPGPLLRGILETAAGNPLFADELLRAYRGADALADAGTDSIEARFELDLQATGLHEVIGAQLRQLDGVTRDVLAALAVWGTEVGAGTLAEMLDRPPGTLEEPLAQAVSSGLVWRDSADMVRFAHDLVREITYEQITEPACRAAHRRAAALLTAAGYRPALVAEHLLRAAGTASDPAVVTALHDAVAATSGNFAELHAPEMIASLLDDVAAISEAAGAGGAAMPEPLLQQRAEALFLAGRGESAEALIRGRITAVTDPPVAAHLQLTLIRSLANRGETDAALEAIERTTAIAGLPGPVRRQLEAIRCWLLVLAGRPPAADERDALMARFLAAGDQHAQASLLSTCACAAFLSGRPGVALELMRARATLVREPRGFRARSSALFLPAAFELDATGPRAAQAALDRAWQLSAERQANWVDPFLGFTAGGIAFAAGDWDGGWPNSTRHWNRARRPIPAGSPCRSVPAPTSTRTAAAPGKPGPGWNHSGTGAFPCNSGTTIRAWPSWPCSKQRGRPVRRPPSRARCGPRPAANPAAGPPSSPPTRPGSRWARWTGASPTRSAATWQRSARPAVSRLIHGMLTANADEIDAAAAEFAGDRPPHRGGVRPRGTGLRGRCRR